MHYKGPPSGKQKLNGSPTKERLGTVKGAEYDPTHQSWFCWSQPETWVWDTGGTICESDNKNNNFASQQKAPKLRLLENTARRTVHTSTSRLASNNPGIQPPLTLWLKLVLFRIGVVMPLASGQMVFNISPSPTTAFPWTLSNYKISPTTLPFPWVFSGISMDFPRVPTKIPTNLGGSKTPIQLWSNLIGRIHGVKEDLIDFGPEKNSQVSEGGISRRNPPKRVVMVFS